MRYHAAKLLHFSDLPKFLLLQQKEFVPATGQTNFDHLGLEKKSEELVGKRFKGEYIQMSTAMADEHSPPLFREGQMVKLKGLVSAGHLNNQRGKISAVLEDKGRYAVTLMSDGQSAPVSVKFSNVEAAKMDNNVLKIDAVPEGDYWSSESLALAISEVVFPLSTEAGEKKRLKQEFHFKDPRLLTAYSKDSKYVDLVIYFDHGDKKSPINHAATKAFKCYGLGGAQNAQNWTEIRGACFVLRQEPPKSRSTTGQIEELPYDFIPYIEISEMVETLQYFSDKDARQVAMTRDAHRLRDWPGGLPQAAPSAGQPFYFGTGIRSVKKMAGDERKKCQSCGVARFMSGSLKGCPCGERHYCGEACQKKDWPEHKRVCKWRLEQNQQNA